MSLLLHRDAQFVADFDAQFRWYLEHANEDVAERFIASVESTLQMLTTQPDIGQRRTFRHPLLRNLRSFCAARPFENILIFYRFTGENVEVWRLMHGARNLSRRLREPLTE